MAVRALKGRTKSGKLRAVKRDDDGETITRQADGARLFLNRPGFPAGPGCARLHAAALTRGERPMDWKPDVCWRCRCAEMTRPTPTVT